MIKERKGKEERFKSLQEIAEYQLNVLSTAEQIKRIESCDNNVTSSGVLCVEESLPWEIIETVEIYKYMLCWQ